MFPPSDNAEKVSIELLELAEALTSYTPESLDLVCSVLEGLTSDPVYLGRDGVAQNTLDTVDQCMGARQEELDQGEGEKGTSGR